MKILFALNSFKSTLSNIDILHLTDKFFSHKNNISIIPISDGGDGFLNTIDFFLSGNLIYERTVNSCDREIDIPIIVKDNNIYIESAHIVGFNNIDRDLFKRHSRGLGIIVKKYIDNYNIYIGLGGSSTVDIGAGFLSELGANIHFAKHYLPCDIRINKEYKNIFGIYDVNNYLEGKNGALIYAYQKGLKKYNENYLLNIFNNFSKKHCIEKKQGAGAAGGIASAIVLLGGKLIHNFIFINKLCNLKRHIHNADIIITNEGIFDNQSFNGKITGIIAKTALKLKKKIIIITGKDMIKEQNILTIEMGEQAIYKPEEYYIESLKTIEEII